MGRRMNRTSRDKTRPAPREIQTENLRPFKAASLLSEACLYLSCCQLVAAIQRAQATYQPKAKMPMCNPWKRK